MGQPSFIKAVFAWTVPIGIKLGLQHISKGYASLFYCPLPKKP